MIQSKTKVEIVTTSKRLEQIVSIMAKESELAVDLEMDSLHHYQEKVCLIQVSTRNDSWLIDPLALDSLLPLALPLANPDILVVMHGADYDIRSLHRDFGIEINNLFDTMIASRFLGIAEIGLAALLKERFDIQLDKKYQKADWSRRPLTHEMCDYAAADTATLLPLHDQLSCELKEKGRHEWLKEECDLLCQARISHKSGPLFLSCKGSASLKGIGLTILEELLQFREQQAILLDRPPFKVFSAELLLMIAEKAPKTMEQLGEIKGMSHLLIARFGDELLKIIIKTLQLSNASWLAYPRHKKVDTSDACKERLKHLKTWREMFSRQIGLDSGVVAPNWLLERITARNPLKIHELDEISDMRQWQIKLYGEQLITILENLTTA